MGLIGNRNVAFRVPVRNIGGTICDRMGASSRVSKRGRSMSEAFTDQRIAYPIGYLHPYAFDLPLKPGGISTFNQAVGTGALTAAAVGGKNAEATLTGSGSLDATGALVVAAIAALSGSGTLTGAILAVSPAAADLAGSGSLTASIGALAGATAALSGSGTASLTPYATGTLEADILPYTELSPAALATAVWGAVASLNNVSGSMGEKLNDAGGAADPWDDVRALTVGKFLGLK